MSCLCHLFQLTAVVVGPLCISATTGTTGTAGTVGTSVVVALGSVTSDGS